MKTPIIFEKHVPELVVLKVLYGEDVGRQECLTLSSPAAVPVEVHLPVGIKDILTKP